MASLVLQTNDGSEKIAKQLQNLSPETIQSFTEAIAMWIGQKNPKPNPKRAAQRQKAILSALEEEST